MANGVHGRYDLADKPIATTKDGKRVFAYNKQGIPICYARRQRFKGVSPTGEQLRCQSIFTQLNGRCKNHGGNAVSGALHYNATHLRSAQSMPAHLRSDMIRAQSDPDLLSLDHEIAMVDVHKAQLTRALELGLAEDSWKKLRGQADALEDSLNNDIENSEKLAIKIIETIRAGSKERALWAELHVVEEHRRKLVATAHIRQKDLRLLMRADQVMSLIAGIASVCKENILRTVTEIENRYYLIERSSVVESSILITNRRTNEILRPEQRMDVHIRNDFFSRIATSLGKLIGKNDSDEVDFDPGRRASIDEDIPTPPKRKPGRKKAPPPWQPPEGSALLLTTTVNVDED